MIRLRRHASNTVPSAIACSHRMVDKAPKKVLRDKGPAYEAQWRTCAGCGGHEVYGGVSDHYVSRKLALLCSGEYDERDYDIIEEEA